ncbi:2Fe-2S iron-sulfur cluster binding domain-containing protein [Amycolatopsis sp. K13G38]|uniref:2Fe-2S iron-sulfur cluster binding domain-containing protein n=1 Tax=Amycolatopsis acididurans TaxID=2724524 RepID=A0ABX1IXX8_9PSEU|nr:2Fe-2S iron-sulfur cluster-binding protein [Amycolatopsis acididurans]NKQ52363.1 2Fe-2S iron-sulfur cluster binding domain-containing protein [Amycolatopsis acididurans]
MNPQFWWFAARAGGLVAWALLTATVVWGLLLRTRLLPRTPPRSLLGLHRFLAGLAVAFTALHTLGLLLDTYLRFGVVDLLVPFAASWRPVPVAFGVLALYLLIAVTVTSVLMRRLGRKWWHRVHLAAYLLFWLATMHLLTAGTDSRQPALRLLVAGAIAAVLFLTLVRVFAPGATPPRAPSAPAFHPLRVLQVRRETPAVVSVLFAVPPWLATAYRHQPGQHVTVRTRVDRGVVCRPYSICTDSDETGVRIAVGHIPGGRLSTWIHTRLRVGDVLDVMTPTGVFTTEPDPSRSRHVLAVAAGSAITPVITIIGAVLAREPRSRCTLVYGNRTTGDILFADRLARLEHQYPGRLRIVHLLSREHPAAPLHHGRISADTLSALLPPPGPDPVDAYLCGPTAMTGEIREALLRRGLRDDRVHSEHFTAPSAKAPPETTTHEHGRHVTIVHNGLSSTVVARPGDTVLDSGLRAGLDLPYSCRAGVCGTCLAVTAGPGPQPILTCQTRSSPGATVDFDAAHQRPAER